MPRNVRNFWIEIDVDGRKERIAAGPVNKDGGFALNIKQRKNGEIINAVTITGQIFSDGTIVTVGETTNGQTFRVETAR